MRICSCSSYLRFLIAAFQFICSVGRSCADVHITLPGLGTHLFHGMLRTAHAARALTARDTTQRRGELALGIAYSMNATKDEQRPFRQPLKRNTRR
eukprot:gene12791-biopygen1217